MSYQVKEISEFQTRDILEGDEYIQVSSSERVNLKQQLDIKLNNPIEVENEEAMESLIISGQAIEGQMYYTVEE